MLKRFYLWLVKTKHIWIGDGGGKRRYVGNSGVLVVVVLDEGCTTEGEDGDFVFLIFNNLINGKGRWHNVKHQINLMVFKS